MLLSHQGSALEPPTRRCVQTERNRIDVSRNEPVSSSEGPEGSDAFRAFFIFGGLFMKLTRDWLAVLAAALLVALVKLGIVAGVPW